MIVNLACADLSAGIMVQKDARVIFEHFENGRFQRTTRFTPKHSRFRGFAYLSHKLRGEN